LDRRSLQQAVTAYHFSHSDLETIIGEQFRGQSRGEEVTSQAEDRLSSGWQ
jgi:hypothetical protein